MNRYLYTLFFFFLTTLCFQSCEQVLETDIGASAIKLVIVSHLTPDNQLKVDIKKTRPINHVSFNPVDEYVTNAVVKVYENMELIEELVLDMPDDGTDGHPTYTSIDFIPEIGVEYTITAEAPDFQKVSATSLIPIGVSVSNVGFNNSLDIRDAAIADVDFSVNLNLTDASTDDNYYHLVFKQELISYILLDNANGDIDTLIQGPPALAEVDIQLLNQISHIQSNQFGGGIFLTDSEFSNQTITLNLEGDFSFDTSKYLPGNFSVEVRTVSKAYYDYYSTITTQSQGDGDGELVEGNPVIENIENGNGIFAGYNSATTTFIIFH